LTPGYSEIKSNLKVFNGFAGNNKELDESIISSFVLPTSNMAKEFFIGCIKLVQPEAIKKIN
jgi:hypothetical protein